MLSGENLINQRKVAIQNKFHNMCGCENSGEILPRTPFQHKDHLSKYKDAHYKEKTVVWTSYLYNVNSYTSKTASLYQKGHLNPWLNIR